MADEPGKLDISDEMIAIISSDISSLPGSSAIKFLLKN